MRIRESFASERKSEIIDYKPKFFIASEGSCSEPKYFEGLSKSVLSENVAIINILRDYAKKFNSHPSFTISMLQEFLLNVTKDKISLNEVKNRIENCNKEHSYNLDLEYINVQIDSIYGKDDNYTIDLCEVEELLFCLFKKEIYKDLSIFFIEYFNAQNVTYSSKTDTLNMVIDRDKGNFLPNQYDEVKKICKDNNINLYVSNPCFEFWLMLHFPDVEKEDKQKMFDNSRVNSKRRYLEKRLHDICKYQKRIFFFEKFEPSILDAIKREKKYAEDIELLKENLGTNVGLLVEKMVHEKNKKAD